jgi:hypothetical protein
LATVLVVSYGSKEALLVNFHQGSGMNLGIRGKKLFYIIYLQEEFFFSRMAYLVQG